MVERKVAPADAGEEEALSPMFSVLISVCESFFVVMVSSLCLSMR